CFIFFFQAEDGIRDGHVTGVQTCALPISIDRLETRHLVTRADHATDRRAWVIHLTPKGEALITKVFAGHQRAMERAMRGLSKTRSEERRVGKEWRYRWAA